MKILAVLLLLITTQVFAASVESRSGNSIDQYTLSDPGNVSGFDGYVIYYSRGVPEVVIEVNTTTHRIIKESYYCWEDVDILECPDDDIGGGVFRSPVLMFLEEQFFQGTVTTGAPLTANNERLIFLAFWHAYRTKNLIKTSIDEMVLDGLNAVQQKRALKFIYFGNGIDIITSKALADARIDNGTVARYTSYGLTNIPVQDRRLIKLFGIAGWYL